MSRVRDAYEYAYQVARSGHEADTYIGCGSRFGHFLWTRTGLEHVDQVRRKPSDVQSAEP